MKKSLQFLFGVSALAFMFVASPVLASEVDVTSENVTTGANSENENEVEIDNDGDVNVTNVGDVDNVASATVNTGDNEQNQNTTGGGLDTGKIDASTAWETVINEGAGLCGCPIGENYDITANFSNDTTGYNSENENELELDIDGDVNLNNIATVLNSISLNAETGDNEQNMNTTAGNLKTGDISLVAGITNVANSGDDDGNDNDDPTVTINFTGSNHLTGAESENENEVDIDMDGNTTVNNNATLENRVGVNANTGDNNQNMNTTAGDTETGDITVETDIVNVANSGGCACPPTKSVDVTANLSNDTTGYNSENENEVDVEADGNTNVNNIADVDNVLSVNADSGNNNQNQNTTGGEVKTGDVSIKFGASNHVN